MKIIIRTHNWQLPWQAKLPEYLTTKGHSTMTTNGIIQEDNFKPDVVIHMWSDGSSHPSDYPEAKHIYYMRRYEFFSPEWRKLDWLKIDHMVFVNGEIKNAVDGWLKENSLKTPTSLIYNCVDLKDWTIIHAKDKTYNIGMVCSIHPKKNIPLALQILDALPEKYTLHLAGPQQDNCLTEYLNHMAIQMKRRFNYYGKLPRKRLDSWWDMMDCCLSTSISEGNPNNIIEAMAKGIKPVVHNWPGAVNQFPTDYVFNSISEAVDIIEDKDISPMNARGWVEDRYSLNNFDKLYDVIMYDKIAI